MYILCVRWVCLCFLCGFAFGEAQVFSWKNPNQVRDSIHKDSLLRKYYDKDYFSKDTLNYIKSVPRPEIDEAIFVKNHRKRSLGNLNSKGSIIRGISFGNQQGSAVKSSMDLQISGKLSDDVSLLASISDQNLPIQADGYTQTLEEFDKIYVQLNIKKYSILRAGHIDLMDQNTYFGRFQRRSMGLEYQTQWGESYKTDVGLSVGVARSEFHRIRIQGIEGNQGPYRLTGKNGELYITIISGSEQVFMDGVLLSRGEDRDYVINYNTGELTFTSFRPVYRQNFITVSYNYTNRNYSRFLITGGINHRREKLKFGLSWFWESDNKNSPIALNLSKEDERILANAGNDENLMYAPSGVQVSYDLDKILYKLVETPNGKYYEFSTNPQDVLYQVAFTHVGETKGDYKIQSTTNNGRVFQYVGKGLGDYEALRRLPAPEKSQVFSSHLEYELNQGKIGLDISLSHRDVNLFSSLDNGKNFGYAGRLFGDKVFRKKDWTGKLQMGYQYIHKQFHILDRIEEVEFARDFNLAQEFNNRTQNRWILGFSNSWTQGSFLNYTANYLQEEQYYKGLKNDIDFKWHLGAFTTDGRFSFLKTHGENQDTQFIRGGVITEWKRVKGSWALGAHMEHNEKKVNQIYEGLSFSWKELSAQKKIGDSTRIFLLSKVYFRENDSVRNNRLEKVNHVLGVMGESQIIQNTKAQLSASIHYRKLYYGGESRNEDFVVGNLKYHQQFFDQGFRIQAFYELGNGQEAQREFQYIRVTDGQGLYKWTDYNGDGVQQLDEFEIAEYADLAQYIRIYTNTIKYLPSNKNKLQLSAFLHLAKVLHSENAFLKRWHLNVSLLSQNAYLKGTRTWVLNPFENNKSSILKNHNFLASIQFSPTETSLWNGNYRYTANRNLVSANFSLEESARSTHFLGLGYWLSKQWRSDWESSFSEISHESQIFKTRNYRFDFFETKPKVTYKFSPQIQAELSASYKYKQRQLGEERLKAYELVGTLQWERTKTAIRANFGFIDNRFSGNHFSIVGNQMLDGLRPGKNQVWTLFFQQQLNSFLILNLNYEGRNSGERTIHTGTVQIKASF